MCETRALLTRLRGCRLVFVFHPTESAESNLRGGHHQKGKAMHFSETKRKKSKEKKSKQKDHVEEAVDKDDDESEKESADEEVAPASDK